MAFNRLLAPGAGQQSFFAPAILAISKVLYPAAPDCVARHEADVEAVNPLQRTPMRGLRAVVVRFLAGFRRQDGHCNHDLSQRRSAKAISRLDRIAKNSRHCGFHLQDRLSLLASIFR
jgi:hypothetical protein